VPLRNCSLTHWYFTRAGSEPVEIVEWFFSWAMCPSLTITFKASKKLQQQLPFYGHYTDEPALAGTHHNPIISASSKSRLVLLFWYRLTQVVLEKRPLKGCSSVLQYRRSVQFDILPHGSSMDRQLAPMCPSAPPSYGVSFGSDEELVLLYMFR